MEEDIQKNFILLSKVAKEKKYAQEYLGLLARRGDIGSVRIGKRWYTTWQWFEEFLENGQKKKTEAICEVQVAEIVAPVVNVETVKTEMVKIEPAFAKATAGEGEKVLVSQPTMEIRREEKIAVPAAVETLADNPEKIAVAVKTKKFEMPVRKNIAGDIRGIGGIKERGGIIEKRETPQIRNFHQERNSRPLPRMEAKFKNISVAEKNRNAVPYQEIKFKKTEDFFSPDFAGREKMAEPLFSRFAFAMSFAVILILVAASGYFVWSGGLFAKGMVAGASDERNVGFSSITSGGDYILVSAGDKMKESLSISRVVLQVAREKSISNKP